MSRFGRVLVVSAAVLLVVLAGAVIVRSASSKDSAPAQRDDAVVEDARSMRAELDRLARAWADGAGTFGYPFWEKAGQRWRTGQITTPMYREYVTGYRDQLEIACELLDGVETSTDTAGDVRRLVRSSCRSRLTGLRVQQRWLREQIQRDALPDGADADDAPDAADDAVSDVDAKRAELDAEIATHEAEARDALQESFRDARLAMDAAQSALDAAGLSRLPEDAFI